MVELRGRLIEDRRPRVTTIEGDAGSAVVALDHAIRVARVDPEAVVVAMRCRNPDEALAAVSRFPTAQIEDPDRVGVARVSEDMHVVPGAFAQVHLVVYAVPGCAPVLGTVEATSVLAILVRRFDDGPDTS